MSGHGKQIVLWAVMAVIPVISIGIVSYYAVNLTNSRSTTASTMTTCNQSASSEIFLTVENDSSHLKLSGVTVSGEVQWPCGSSGPTEYLASENIANVSTPTNGTIFVGANVGNYTLTLTYLRQTYPITFDAGAEQNVNVTVGLPSARVTVAACALNSSY